MAQKVQLKLSQFAEKFLYLNGHQFSLDDYPHLRRIYDSPAQDIVMMFSRQTAKSTTMAMRMIAQSAMMPHFKTLFIAPTVDQTKVFSHDRVTPVLESSPFIKKNYLSTSLPQNVFMKSLLNGSKMYLRYALRDADRIRGYSADQNIFDEVQDAVSGIIPVVNETMSRSMFKLTMYAGTPKRSKGTLADIWAKSTKNEFILKCKACNHWNILGENNIGSAGVVCERCAGPIDTKTGQWVSTYSSLQPPIREGYRVCALHFANAPWVNWQRDILQKRENTQRAIFFNETLALEYDDGVSPVTEMELISCCDPDMPMKSEPDKLDASYQSVAGIDYGPINSERSFTNLVIVQRRDSKYVVTFAKKFIGKEADFAFIHDEVPRIMNIWKARFLAADYGMGEASNAEIRKRIGYERLWAFNYSPNQKDEITWNPKMPAHILNRTKAMSRVFDYLKSGKIVFPDWKYFEPFASDILNIQSEFDEDLGTHKFVNIGPDDFFQALTFAIILLEGIHGELRSEFTV